MTDADLKHIISEGLEKSIPYSAYTAIVEQLVENNGTSGANQHEDLVHFTKLNAQRSKRLSKTIELNASTAHTVSSLEETYTWLVLSESWCGDAAQILPLLDKMASENDGIDLRLVFRDEHPDLMDQFLTNGGKSIPKLIILNRHNEVVGTWGPRPKEAQALYDTWKNDPNKPPYKEFQVEMQKWYLKDKGFNTFEEIGNILASLEKEASVLS